MEDAKRIYSLLIHSKGLRVREIAKELDLDNYYVAEVLYSTENISYWYQDDEGLWFAKEDAIQIEETKEDLLLTPLAEQKRFNLDRYLQRDISDMVRSYLIKVSRYRLYSNEEIHELFRRYRNGDIKAYDLIVKSQQKLVVGIAFLYCKDGVQVEDLIQEGNIGLLRAIERFDNSQNYSFYNYAKSYILQAISFSMTYLPYLIRLPLNLFDQYRKVMRFKEKYEQSKGYLPSVNDIKIGEDLDNKRVVFLSQLPDDLRELVCIEDMDNYESDLLISPEAGQIHESLRKEIDRVLSTITHREAAVIRLYYGFDSGKPMTLEEIGIKFELTRERVRQVKEIAVRRLQHARRIKVLKSYLS